MEGDPPAELVLEFARMPGQEAGRFRVSKLDRADLIQAGFVGLLIAAVRFDPTRGPFEPYARLWIRKEMQRAIASSEFAAVIPPQHVGRVVALRSLASDIPSMAMLSGRLGLSSDTTRSLLSTLEVALPAGEFPMPSVGVEDAAILNVLGASLMSAVADLPEAERAVVVESYGLAHGQSKSDRATARELGISPTTVRARLDRALTRLRRRLGVDLTDTRSTNMNTVLRHLAWPDFGFAIDIPGSWEVFPGANNGSNEIARVKRDPAERSLTLIVWKQPAHGATLEAFAAGVQRGLEAGGYKDLELKPTSRPSLDGHQLIARQDDGWTTRQYYFGGGAAVYVLGWGTPDPAADQGDITAVVDTFRILD